MFVRPLKMVLIVGMLALMSLPATAAAEEFPHKAEKFIVNLAKEAITKLTDKSVTLEEQEKRFREIMKEYIAFKTIARWVLGGRYWRSATDQQQEEYLALFEQLMVSTYAHRFQNYSGETLEVSGVRAVGEMEALVQTTLMRPNADKPLRVDWRVRGSGDVIKVIDVMVEGLSMAQAQRSEFSSVMRDNGGDINALMEILENRLETARADRLASTQKASQ